MSVIAVEIFESKHTMPVTPNLLKTDNKQILM